MSAPPDEPRNTQEFEALIQYLKNNRGFDFSGYKRSSLRRRMDKRMLVLRVERYGDYLDYLEGASRGVYPALQHHPHQCHRLFPRYGCLGDPHSRSHPAACRRQAAARAHSGLERWLRLRRRSLHSGHCARRGTGP
jgi:hypothetical protein